jgi:hypothetical protein
MYTAGAGPGQAGQTLNPAGFKAVHADATTYLSAVSAFSVCMVRSKTLGHLLQVRLSETPLSATEMGREHLY